MVIVKKTADLRAYTGKKGKKRQPVGFVPTMGALHPGHISLIETCRKDNGTTICSIFVNPTQFNDPKDFEKYPVTIEKDIYMLESAGCDLLFLPSVEEIYPDGLGGSIRYPLGYLETILEGKYRPGHFQGVCRVMQRLLDITRPDQLYLGQKDYQQCMVIRKLIELTGPAGLNVSICPTLRETDGLAMSSRNTRLTAEERAKAPAIYRALQYIKENWQKGNLRDLERDAIAELAQQGFKTDYIAIADAATLEIVNDWDGRQELVALAAAFLNEVRLIDNLLLGG